MPDLDGGFLNVWECERIRVCIVDSKRFRYGRDIFRDACKEHRPLSNRECGQLFGDPRQQRAEAVDAGSQILGWLLRFALCRRLLSLVFVRIPVAEMRGVPGDQPKWPLFGEQCHPMGSCFLPGPKGVDAIQRVQIAQPAQLRLTEAAHDLQGVPDTHVLWQWPLADPLFDLDFPLEHVWPGQRRMQRDRRRNTLARRPRGLQQPADTVIADDGLKRVNALPDRRAGARPRLPLIGTARPVGTALPIRTALLVGMTLLLGVTLLLRVTLLAR